MGIEQGAGPVCLLEYDVGDRAASHPVVQLARDDQDPTRRRDGDPVCGQLADEWVVDVPPGLLRQIGCGPAKHLVLLLEQSDPFPSFA
ncbi:hypothetical protein ACIO52_22080 [Nocardia sp. NPDC087230]|uniref:hypothetical protein n=1 Tax=Nocardia sp. NPDC087230 TaxID=3364331 RepID=UPI003808E050